VRSPDDASATGTGARDAASRVRYACLALVLGVACAVRTVNLRWMLAHPMTTYQLEWREGDMAPLWEWSSVVLRGDVLGRTLVHPYTAWMRRVASPETWERWRGGRSVFFKAPLYPYALAATRWVVGDDLGRIGFCQLALGVLNSALVFLLALRFFDLAVATAAGLIAALYGPSLLYESFILRDVLSVTVSLLLLLGLSRCGAGDGRWFAAGLLFALALLERELTLVFTPFIALWAVQRLGDDRRALARAASACVTGAVLGLLPLVARNVMVGAPPLALSAIGHENFVYGHTADGAPTGFTFPPSAVAILRQADGRLGDTIRLTLATYEGDWSRLVGHEAERLAAIFASFEAADNVSWYYFADRSSLFRHMLRWEVMLALAIPGLWLARRYRTDDRLLLYFLASCLLGLQFTNVVGRYRLVPAAVLTIYAGVTVRCLAFDVGRRRWRTAATTGLATVATLAISVHLLGSYAARLRVRPFEYVAAAQTYATRGQPERAYEELRAGLQSAYADRDDRRLQSGWVPVARAFAAEARRLGRTEDGARILRSVLATHDADPDLRALVGELERGDSVTARSGTDRGRTPAPILP
jgi:hypothetical protein